MKTDIMNSLEQYIDIYRENSEAIDAHSAPVMNAARPITDLTSTVWVFRSM